MKLKIFFCHFPSPWVLRMSGMGCYGQKCEKMPKSLHLNVQPILCKVLYRTSLGTSVPVLSTEPWLNPLNGRSGLTGGCLCLAGLAGTGAENCAEEAVGSHEVGPDSQAYCSSNFLKVLGHEIELIYIWTKMNSSRGK